MMALDLCQEEEAMMARWLDISSSRAHSYNWEGVMLLLLLLYASQGSWLPRTST